MNNKKKWVTLAVIALGAGVIYELPYLRYTFYDPLREGLGLTHEQFGELMSLYGLLAMILYIPGGLLADRISHKYLLTFSLVGTGLGGLYLSTWPAFGATKVLFAFWAVTSILTYWSVLMKATSLLGSEKEQGRLFALSEGGRGIMTSFLALTAAAMVARLGSSPESFSFVLYFYSGVCILMGIISYLIIPHNRIETSETSTTNIIHDMLIVCKMPITWLVAISIFSMYTIYTTSGYFTPYTTKIYGVSVAGGAVIATFRTHLTRPISGIVGSILSAKLGGSIPGMKVIIIATSLLLMFTLILPVSSGLIILLVIFTVLLGLLAFVLRGLYFAPLGEVGTPKHLMGATIGVVSILAYASDVFNFKFVGRILDTVPGHTGYKIVFLYMIGLSVIAFISLIFLGKMVSKRKDSI